MNIYYYCKTIYNFILSYTLLNITFFAEKYHSLHAKTFLLLFSDKFQGEFGNIENSYNILKLHI